MLLFVLTEQYFTALIVIVALLLIAWLVLLLVICQQTVLFFLILMKFVRIHIFRTITSVQLNSLYYEILLIYYRLLDVPLLFLSVGTFLRFAQKCDPGRSFEQKCIKEESNLRTDEEQKDEHHQNRQNDNKHLSLLMATLRAEVELLYLLK